MFIVEDTKFLSFAIGVINALKGSCGFCLIEKDQLSPETSQITKPNNRH